MRFGASESRLSALSTVGRRLTRLFLSAPWPLSPKRHAHHAANRRTKSPLGLDTLCQLLVWTYDGDHDISRRREGFAGCNPAKRKFAISMCAVGAIIQHTLHSVDSAPRIYVKLSGSSRFRIVTMPGIRHCPAIGA